VLEKDINASFNDKGQSESAAGTERPSSRHSSSRLERRRGVNMGAPGGVGTTTPTLAGLVKAVYLELLDSSLLLALTSMDRYIMRINGYAVDHEPFSPYTTLALSNLESSNAYDQEILVGLQMGYIGM
jgi:hypothetical protein